MTNELLLTLQSKIYQRIVLKLDTTKVYQVWRIIWCFAPATYKSKLCFHRYLSAHSWGTPSPISSPSQFFFGGGVVLWLDTQERRGVSHPNRTGQGIPQRLTGREYPLQDRTWVLPRPGWLSFLFLQRSAFHPLQRNKNKRCDWQDRLTTGGP